MFPYDRPTDLNARGRMMQARRHNAAADVWKLTDILPRLGLRFRRSEPRR